MHKNSIIIWWAWIPFGQTCCESIHPHRLVILQQQRWSNLHPKFKGDLQDYPNKLKITFQIQKNRQNGQSITLVADDAHPEICPVWASYRIFIQANRLDQSDSEPLAVFVNKNDITKYLTGNKISDVLQSIARMVHLDLSEDEMKRFFPH